MTKERRYTDAEVREILTRATDTRPGLPAGRDQEEGLTLAELQDIGTEVGIPADRVARAARALDQPRGIERTLGLPMTVGHSLPLDRALSDHEWERLVADLRETFRARGKVRQHGRLREWSNGNLHALVEPTDDGWRLRMGTTKGSARQLLGMGGSLLAIVAVLAVLWMLGLGMDTAELARISAILGTLGVGMGAAGALQLPLWAGRRREQMEGVAARVEGMLGEGEG